MILTGLTEASDPMTLPERLAQLAREHFVVIMRNPAITAAVVRDAWLRAESLGVPFSVLPNAYQALAENPAIEFLLLELPRLPLFEEGPRGSDVVRSVTLVAAFEAFCRPTVWWNPAGLINNQTVAMVTGELSLFEVPLEARAFFFYEALRLPPSPDTKRPFFQNLRLDTLQQRTLSAEYALLVREALGPSSPFQFADVLRFVDTVAYVWSTRFGLPTKRLPAPGAVSLTAPYARYLPSVEVPLKPSPPQPPSAPAR